MTSQSTKPEISGTRSGYVIRYTCPMCSAENTIVSKTPKDHYKETHDATCSKCRKRSRVLTPRWASNPGYSPVRSYTQIRTY
jgi:transcription elongation factor Elf1